MSVHRVGVVGAGTIGRSVAHALADHGLNVVLVDIDRHRLDAAMAHLRREMRLSRLRHPAPDRPVDQALALITPTTDYDQLAGADLVVENVVEDIDTKRQVYQRLDRACMASTVFAANTSVFPITALSAFVEDPSRVVGIHFMNPVPHRPTVELVRGNRTSTTTVAKAQQLLSMIGKDWVEVRDSAGFVSNRVLMLAVNEAAYLAQEGVASPAEIDRVFTSCFGHPMGLLATADLIGIDTVLDSLTGLWKAFGNNKFQPCPLLTDMVAAGHLGRKSGRGFHQYPTTAHPDRGSQR